MRSCARSSWARCAKVDLSLKFIMAFGLCFQLPVLLTLMGMAGLVSAEGLGNVRKYAVVGILVLAALVTPPDVITQVILFVVVYGLYEISIQLVRMVETRRRKRQAEEGILDDDGDADGEDALVGQGAEESGIGHGSSRWLKTGGHHRTPVTK